MFAKTFILGLILSTLFSTSVLAAENSVSYASSEADRARNLLDKAVAYYQSEKDMALGAFSRQGKFTDGDLYVYVLGTDGVMLASGGSSSVLIGRHVSGMEDYEGQLFFKEMLAMANSVGNGTVEYHWLNRSANKVEHKITYFQKVEERVIAVGYYIPRATDEEAKTLLKNAASAVRNNPERAFAAFNDLNGGYVQDDLYVFVIALEDAHFRAHGVSPRLVGSDGMSLLDTDGRPVIQEMISVAKTKSRGAIDYAWLNPVTGVIEKKHTFFRRIDGFLVAVGFYVR